VKLLRLLPVKPPVVTRIGPLVAPVGTVAVIWVGELTMKEAAVWLNLTAVAPVKLVPVITTDVPTGPLAGVKELIVGHVVVATLNGTPYVSVCDAGVVSVTTREPSVAPEGTTAVIWVVESVVKVDATPLNVTDDTVLKPVPLRVISHPTGPLVGENVVTVWSAAAGPAVTPTNATTKPTSTDAARTRCRLGGAIATSRRDGPTLPTLRCLNGSPDLAVPGRDPMLLRLSVQTARVPDGLAP
jgi:hypothetical protein